MSSSHGGCFSLLKFLVFTVNFILWLVGLGVLGVSLWLLFDRLIITHYNIHEVVLTLVLVLRRL